MNTIHVVSHTHWDREWYRTFQEFRIRLVELVDRLLDMLEQDPDYRHFTLDGQTVVLDDYLEVRPDQELRLRRLVQDGRILVGPWYILPDEFLEGPEALIRNWQLGRHRCRRLASKPQPMESIAYLPDTFGHIGQLPQIAALLGMSAVCLWRGVGDAPTEFRWAAPDGTELLVLHLLHSYSNGAWLPREATAFVAALASERDSLARSSTSSHLLVMQGTDHMPPVPETPALLSLARKHTGDEVTHSTLPHYCEAVRTELGAEGLARLPLVRGELRSPRRAHLLPGVLSARMWIKQANSRCETLLTRFAEPLCALTAAGSGSERNKGLLGAAWMWLLQNHPHDSICGCSVDQVHREMRVRFAWSQQIAEQLIRTGLVSLAEQAGPPRPGDRRLVMRILVFNPLPGTRSDATRVALPPALPSHWHVEDLDGKTVPVHIVQRRVREHMNELMSRERFLALLESHAPASAGAPYGLELAALRTEGDTASVEVRVGTHYTTPVQVGAAEVVAQLAQVLQEGQVQHFHVLALEEDGLEIEFLARDVPGVGYTQFCVVADDAPADDPARAPAHSLQSGPTSGEPVPAPAWIENEYYRVEASPLDGTLCVTDKHTGLTLVGMNRYVDSGDRGDEYTFCPPEADVVVDRPSARPKIRRSSDPLGQVLDIELSYQVPRSLAPGDRSRRSDEQVDLPITTTVRLSPGVRRIQFATHVLNTASDHRLRVAFPTQLETDRAWAEGHFDVVERCVALPGSTQGWPEQPAGTQPQLTFVDLSDGTRGVMLVNRGLPEYEAIMSGGPGEAASGGTTLSLTLLRSVGWLSRTDLATRSGHAGPALETPEAQCPGQATFRYALVPHAGNYLTAQQEAHAFNAPLHAICVETAGGAMPASCAMVTVWPRAIVLSSLKPPEDGDGLVLRLYNSAPVALNAHVRFWQHCRRIDLVTMDESTCTRTLAAGSETASLWIRSKEIVTLRAELPPGSPGTEPDR